MIVVVASRSWVTNSGGCYVVVKRVDIGVVRGAGSGSLT